MYRSDKGGAYVQNSCLLSPKLGEASQWSPVEAHAAVLLMLLLILLLHPLSLALLPSCGDESASPTCHSHLPEPVWNCSTERLK